MKTYKKIVLYTLLALSVERFCHWKTEGFTIRKIQADLPFHPEWECTPLSGVEQSEVEKALGQKFSYLASGGSCYVFASEDGRYVLKLFKHHRLYPYPWAEHLPLPRFLKQKIDHYQRKRARVFASCKSAFEELRDDTALLFVHLNKTGVTGSHLTLVDKLGIVHKISADNVEFLLQKKAEIAYAHIDQLMAKHDILGAQHAVGEIRSLIWQIAHKGFKDLDPNVETNVGFIDGKAVKIDVGPLVKDENRKKEMMRSVKYTHRLNKWLKDRYPELYESLNP
ncbi:MAG: hypothetical protein ACHQT8_01910 [Chlamydiales bacterium]